MKSVGSKSRTSAAICVSSPAGSQAVMRPTPERPSIMAFQNLSTPMPTGLTTPSPVTTTRRSLSCATRPGDVLFDVLHRLADFHDLLRVFVGDLDLELLFQRHHQFDHVQGVGPQVLHEGCLRGDLGLIHAQLLDDDAFHAVEYCRH